ncbi:MAG: AMP-binding protein [Bacteroidetes bacterium]|nr:AMP-binding protein [Bacteroidota bacterium]MBU1114733.1 AMP-binding protein [Bacteroidota bacterium]MBU1796864.1 AMP-binding protein [Bacteroidota bacterium]
MFLQPSEKTAIIYKNEVISYNLLLKTISQYSTLFDEAKTQKIAIYLENRPEWVYTFYSGMMTQSILVPIDFMLPPDDVAYILNDCQPEVIFYSNETETRVNETLLQVNHAMIKINIDNINLAEIDCETRALAPYNDDDVFSIIYTSGTTGKPKGVMLTFGNIESNIYGTTKYVEIFKERSRTLVLLPLHHILPLGGTVLMPLYVGGTIVFSPSLLSEDVIATLQNHKINIIVSVPRFFALIRKGIREKIDSNKIASLLFKIAEKRKSRSFSRKIFKKVHEKFGGEIETFVSGGAKLDENVARDFQTLGFEVLEGYGMTETSPMITFIRPGRVKIGSAGEVFPGMEVKFEDGEILARGPNLMKGYYNKEAETNEAIIDGWLHTGDLGHLDDEGFLFVTGRKKELIVLSNGKNITPEEVEIKLLAVDDITEEVGVYMEKDQLFAIIYPNLVKVKTREIADISEYYRWEVIAKYNEKSPSYRRITNFTIVEEPLPRTRLSKLKRFMLPEIGKGNSIRKEKKEADLEFEEYKIIKDFLVKEKEKEVFPSDHFELDLALDSLDKITFLSFLSSTFGVELVEDNLVKYCTVEKISNYIKENKTKINIETIDWKAIFKETVNLNLPKSWITVNLFKNWSRLVFMFYFKIKAEGLERLPKGPFIIAPNHQSFFDGLFVTMFIKNKIMKQTYFYAKKKHIGNKFINFLANKNNVIVVDINNDLKKSLQKMAAVLKSGKNMIIFPEGTRSVDGELGDYKKTFAILSSELNVPIVPVAIGGAYKALPKGSFIPRPFKKICVKFLEPINPAGHSYDSLTNEVYKKVASELKC